ncbi:MAG: type II toxin-antitoxin system RelE/ParE family toxin [Bryobacter sp.]|jgi:mRNA interferase RelE/StbE|nr:type II toxin-antitoxin system RelE/ParE family toxin [Bryobacter sp.]
MGSREGRPWKVEFSRSALKEFLALPQKTRDRIVEALAWLAAHPQSTVLEIKKLHAPLPVFRLRVGDYRVIYERQALRLVILVVRVGHRGHAYRGL